MKIQDTLQNVLQKPSAVIMLELPEEAYFDNAVDTLQFLTAENAFSGVYVSFQRPVKTLRPQLTKRGVDTDRLWFVDAATALDDGSEPEDLERCTRISEDLDIDELVHAIYTALDELEVERKFVFIDSLTTISLYKPLSETLRFSEFLMRTLKSHETEKIILFFNVAQGLAQKKFIQDIAMHVDQTITVGEP